MQSIRCQDCHAFDFKVNYWSETHIDLYVIPDTTKVMKAITIPTEFAHKRTIWSIFDLASSFQFHMLQFATHPCTISSYIKCFWQLNTVSFLVDPSN